MKHVEPAILHHKFSLEDGHVTAQIKGIEGYRGIMVTRSLKEKRSRTPFKSILSLHAIQQNGSLLKKANVVGIHIHHGSLAPHFHFLKDKYGLPLFVGFRGKDATSFPKKKENRMQLKKLFKKGDLFFPVCNHLAQKINRLGCPVEKIRVLYGGVDIDRFLFKLRTIEDHQKIRYLAIGRFVEKKGFSDLIRAFAAVKQKQDRVELILIGQGPYEAEYRKLISQLQLKEDVRIIPWIDYRKIQDCYYNAHIFCAPSCTDRNGNQEGIPNTLKEAMATGMPVVSTTHAGIPELVEAETSGLLVPEGSVIKLASAMNDLAEHPEIWGDLGRNARNKIERDFNLITQLEKQKKYYDEIIFK